MIKTSHISALAVSALFVSVQVASAATDPRIVAARNAFPNTAIEQIAVDARNVATQFVSGTPSPIKLSGKNVKTLIEGAADAIIAKVPPPIGPAEHSIDNQGDEIAESAAQILGGLIAAPKMAKLGVAKKIILTLLKGAVKTAKKTAQLTGNPVFRDVAGSVALTIRNNTAFDANEEKVEKFLKKKSKSIAGKVNKAGVTQGFEEGFNSVTADTKYEDGNLPQLSTTADPITDLRPA